VWGVLCRADKQGQPKLKLLGVVQQPNRAHTFVCSSSAGVLVLQLGQHNYDRRCLRVRCKRMGSFGRGAGGVFLKDKEGSRGMSIRFLMSCFAAWSVVSCVVDRSGWVA
jgi:hypothetical protein